MKIKALLTASLLATTGLMACDSDPPEQPVPWGGSTGDKTVGEKVGGSDSNDDPTDNGTDASEGAFEGGENNTFDHDNDLSANGGTDPFEILKQRQEEGPPEIRTRLHSCQKPQIAAIGNMLVDFGVDLNATANPDTAGELFQAGQDALGAANYLSRSGETITWTNSGSTKMQDIWVQAADEIIAAMPNVAHCQVAGIGVEMFDENDQCVEDAVTCLIGRPASADHLAICNHIVATADTPDEGKSLAVAAMVAAAHTCE
jgi:hypothetical protein